MKKRCEGDCPYWWKEDGIERWIPPCVEGEPCEYGYYDEKKRMVVCRVCPIVKEG